MLSFSHWGFDRKARTGRLIVHEGVAGPVLGVFRQLYAKRFPIRKVVPVDAYDASDFRSIEQLRFTRPLSRPVREEPRA